MEQRQTIAALVCFCIASCLALSSGVQANQRPSMVYSAQSISHPSFSPKLIQNTIQEARIGRRAISQGASSSGAYFAARTTLPGTLVAEVKEQRSYYQNNVAPLYVVPLPNGNISSQTQCSGGNGWYGVFENTPQTRVCLPWWQWPASLLRWSIAKPVPGDPQCSFAIQAPQYPECLMGFHCDINSSLCVSTKATDVAAGGSCPAASGLAWSSSHGRCVQCLKSNIVLPFSTPTVAPLDHYRSGYICNSDGNAVPPLTETMADSLATQLPSFLRLGILICIILSELGYGLLWLYRHRIKQYRALHYEQHDSDGDDDYSDSQDDDNSERLLMEGNASLHPTDHSLSKLPLPPNDAHERFKDNLRCCPTEHTMNHKIAQLREESSSS